MLQADAVGDERLEAYAATVLRAFAEVETALAAESLLGDQEVALQRSADELGAAQRLALERYRNGVGDYLSVLESQSREFTARSALLAVRRERLTNRVDLYLALALGGGFQPEPVLDGDFPLQALSQSGETPEDDGEGS